MGGLSNQGLLDLITHLQSRECSIGKQPKTQPTGTEIFSVLKRKEKKMRELKESELTSVAGGGSFFEAVEAGLNTASRSGSLSAGWAEFKRVLRED